MNKLPKLAEIYMEKYTHARSILFMRPKRLTFIGKQSLSKLPASLCKCTEQPHKKRRTVLWHQNGAAEMMPNKEGAAPSSRLSKWCRRFISKELSHPHCRHSLPRRQMVLLVKYLQMFLIVYSIHFMVEINEKRSLLFLAFYWLQMLGYVLLNQSTERSALN